MYVKIKTNNCQKYSLDNNFVIQTYFRTTLLVGVAMAKKICSYASRCLLIRDRRVVFFSPPQTKV